VTEDFEFRVSYADFGFQVDPTSRWVPGRVCVGPGELALTLSGCPFSALSGQLLSTHKVSGVKNAFAKHPNATAMVRWCFFLFLAVEWVRPGAGEGRGFFGGPLLLSAGACRCFLLFSCLCGCGNPTGGEGAL
jgi:hypothetical protein